MPFGIIKSVTVSNKHYLDWGWGLVTMGPWLACTEPWVPSSYTTLTRGGDTGLLFQAWVVEVEKTRHSGSSLTAWQAEAQPEIHETLPQTNEPTNSFTERCLGWRVQIRAQHTSSMHKTSSSFSSRANKQRCKQNQSVPGTRHTLAKWL